ncbi:MAG: putative transport system permease protein [Gaiellaceae bacterium]|nr:putative transport system permease protein [Gaiellaceae bacterium]
MIKFALKGLLGRKLRTALTAVAIVLGVAMVSGTYVLTDSIDQAFDAIFNETRQGSDAVITGRSAFDLSDGGGSEAPTLDESLLERVRALPEVQRAEGGVDSENTILIDQQGKAIVGNAPSLGFSIADGESPFNPLRLVEGSWPGPNEIVIDEATAKKKGFEVGDTIAVQAEGPVQRYRISGVIRFGDSLSTIGDATLAGFDLPTAQRLYGKEGRLDEIAVSSASNVSEPELLAALEQVLPPTAQVRTGQAQATEEASDTNEFITFLQGFLLAFAGIALFVGSFVIANSLAITIAQRTREFATIRTIGASRKQVLGSIVLESLVVGILASVAGLFLGLGLATILFKLFDAVGFTLPNTGLVFETRTVVVSLMVGILVTLVASLRPAIRATRVPPIAAVREGATLPESRFAPYRTLGASLLTVFGFAAILYALFAPDLGTTSLLIWLGVGALLVFLGFALLSVRFIRPLASALGWPATKIGGAAGALARDNARRNPQRTASTASALMIGLALVTLVAVLAAGITSTFRGAVEDLWTNADYAVTSQNNFSPIPAAVSKRIADVPGVDAVGDVRTGDAEAFGKPFFATAVTPDLSTMLELSWKEGAEGVLAQLGEDGAIVDDGYAGDHNLRLGSPIRLTFANGDKENFRIEGIFDPPPGGSPFGPVTISAAEWDKHSPNPRNLFSFVRMEGGQTDANQTKLEQALREFPNAKAQTRSEFIDNQIAGLSAVLNILYVLLALSVIVSLFGIVNTLVLTVFERTREIGMLRAIGMTRRQVRRMIRHESVITALIGGFLGIILGVVLGALLVARIDFIDFTLPVGSLIVFTIATIAVGIIAAVWPARRAARLNVLEALQYE